MKRTARELDVTIGNRADTHFDDMGFSLQRTTSSLWVTLVPLPLGDHAGLSGGHLSPPIDLLQRRAPGQADLRERGRIAVPSGKDTPASSEVREPDARKIITPFLLLPLHGRGGLGRRLDDIPADRSAVRADGYVSLASESENERIPEKRRSVIHLANTRRFHSLTLSP